MKQSVKMKPKPSINLYEKAGDFFLDIAKLVFAGVVLSTLLDITENKTLMLILGIVTTGIMMAIGFNYYYGSNNNNKKE